MFVLPWYRDDDSVNVPLVVIALIIVDTLIWVLTSGWNPPHVILASYGFVPAHARVLSAFTSMFLHIGFWHIAGNMWFLWMFGRRVERFMGAWLFGVIYLASGFGGALLHLAFNRGSAIPCVGASGAISGIVGCFFVLFPRAEFDLDFYLGWWRVKEIHTHTTAAVGVWIAEQTILGLLSQAVHFSSVAFWGHVGGFVVGLLAGVAFRNGVPSWRHERVLSKEDITRLDLRG